METDEGVRLAIKAINASGGLPGKKVELETEENHSEPKEAKPVAVNYSADPQIVAVIGEAASTRTMVAAPVFQRAGMPMVSPSSANLQFTREGIYIFRVCFLDPFPGAVLAKFAPNDLSPRKVAIVRQQTSDYSVGLSNVFKENFTRLGRQIIAVDRVVQYRRNP